MRIITALLIALFLVVGCKKKDPPIPPEAVLLVFPDKNSDCTIGNDINETTREIDFRWQKANNTETYELRVTNINSNITQTISTPALSARLPLSKGAAYSWVVLSKNSMVPQKVSSDTWYFFHSGFETTHPPFPAEIMSPKIGTSLFKDINNEVTLKWSGSDIDDDITGFDIYLDTVSPPVTVLVSLTGETSEQKASVASQTVYYWKVVTRDGDGHTSDSGIFDFRVY